MIRPVLAILAMTLPAYAQPSHIWGTSSVTLSPADAPAVAQLEYHNGYHIAADVTTMTVTLDGMAVQVTVEAGPDRQPDTFTVTVPEGFVAVPQTGVVEEDTGVVVMIYSVEGVGA